MARVVRGHETISTWRVAMTTDSGRCAKCFQPLEAGARFCGRCGTEVGAQADEARFQPGAPAQIECPSCSHLNMPDARFCERCGTQLQSSAQAHGWDQPPTTQNPGYAQQGQSEDPWATGPGYERPLREDESCPRCGNFRRPEDEACSNCGLPFGQRVSEAGVPTAVSYQGDPAGFWVRLIAWLIDAAIFGISGTILWPLLFGQSFWETFIFEIGGEVSESRGIGWAFLITMFFYHMILIALFNTTPGKSLLGIRVLDPAGNRRIGWRRSGLRAGGMVLGSIFIWVGYLIAPFRKDRRALHDLIAGTYPTMRQ